jgi:sulfoquinovose isomerase
MGGGGRPLHEHWLRARELDLLRFGDGALREDGLAAWLDDDGNPDLTKTPHTYMAARMATVYFLGALRGVPGARARAEGFLRGLDVAARDAANGGWRESARDDGTEDKSAYTHAFVVLAASTGTMANDARSQAVLAEALELVDQRFWEPSAGLFVDAWDATWTGPRSYRGLNSNMHMVEAMLAATDATGDPEWASRAVRVCRFVIAQASANDWRIPEHFDADWRVDLAFNREHPADQFKPYGATVGHGFEWARLIAQIAVGAAHAALRDDLMEAAEALFVRAADGGWAVDGAPGFVYTTDWDGAPVVAERMHWVLAEAISAAATLAAYTGRDFYARRYSEWWDYAALHVIDSANGSWRHELDANNQPSSTVWEGKPDLYHAYQAVLIPQLVPSTSIARAVIDAQTSPQPSGAQTSQRTLS